MYTHARAHTHTHANSFAPSLLRTQGRHRLCELSVHREDSGVGCEARNEPRRPGFPSDATQAPTRRDLIYPDFYK